jgi:hypothetical protein
VVLGVVLSLPLQVRLYTPRGACIACCARHLMLMVDACCAFDESVTVIVAGLRWCNLRASCVPVCVSRAFFVLRRV